MTSEIVATQLKAIDFSQDISQLNEDFVGQKWVLEKIDKWLLKKNDRFFILLGEPGVGKSAIAAHLTQKRKEIIAAHHFCKLGDEDTVCPSRVLRSLAVQLDKTLPYYYDALVNTIKSTLSAEARINIDKIEDLEDGTLSIVKRFRINNVDASDIANELDILIRAPLAALPKIYKEKGETPPEIAVILIDGLDVAVTMEEGVQEDEDLATLFAALSEDESLPSWIRFLFTTRPDRRVLREFEPLKPYLLEEMSEKNLADIRQYIDERIAGSSTIQNQVAETPMETQKWIEQLTERSQGNFRYIKSLLNDLEVGHSSLIKMPVLPVDLERSYADDFAQRFPKDEWGQRHDQILRSLMEAKHPLAEDELATLTEIRPRQLRQDLWGLRQFLDVHLVRYCSIWDKKENHYETYETFTIFHDSLKAYLMQRSLATTCS
ncbi:hypothetical protein [Phormidium tenue]|uniref:Orc1-like AAA ATPase domain-containing protein n=1 Tax=Phormidium tenue NIES-30 TaxID=549789 RepID=A0A1U7IXQ6_9CYAN|nr:hypothetical protein [Phormidium tenue]MBD2234986.1 hypothetical protein [Phormidium tenue FACHB-1052]OKH43151.1 hypothetical protein NIES30_25530 [Phormidium tenue NIES-30]